MMKSGGILNAALCHAIGSLGHGDALLVTDAGFPIPAASNRIDLAVARDLPDLRTVLGLIGDECIVEAITVAEEVPRNNPELDEWLTSRWPRVERSTIPHSELLVTGAARAKFVVRTGAFEPWGNVLLTSGVDVPRWFTNPRVVVPDYYRARLAEDA
jgi:simple sugar transport system permease protein/D-ribose pyranase